MIQANELRLGNYVLGQTKQITKVDGFFNNNKAIYTNVEDERVRFIIHNLKECEGVELTEEILLKCGFKKENLKPSNRHSEYFSIWIEDYKYSFSFAYFRNNWGFYHSYTDALKEEDNNRFDAISFGIKYLHQLQNLYFTLSNEELKINL